MNRVERLIASPLGALLARPWFDAASLKFFEHWFFPLSRLWAAARAAHGSVETFFAEVPMPDDAAVRHRVVALLERFEQRRAAAARAEAQWDTAFFGVGTGHEADLAVLEANRLERRVAYNAMRRHFRFLANGAETPAVRFDIQNPIELATIYARIFRAPERLFRAPTTMPAMEISKRIGVDCGEDYWLRFASPSAAMGDTVYARVHEPRGIEDPPTLVFLHGVCVEFDHWNGMVNDVAELVRRGIRVVRPEAPWHGRRVPEGRYGGEKFIGTMPLGTLNFFSAQIREVAVLVQWLRGFSKSRVAVGGSSLGAHVARLVATRCKDWPDRLHPDALFLITPCGRLEDAAVRGAFARIWKNVEASASAGWSEELRTKWMNLIDPDDLPVVASANIVAVIGQRDRVTPFDSGLELLDKLALPAGNRFVWQQGHFSTPLQLIRDPRPVLRLQELLSGA